MNYFLDKCIQYLVYLKKFYKFGSIYIKHSLIEKICTIYIIIKYTSHISYQLIKHFVHKLQIIEKRNLFENARTTFIRTYYTIIDTYIFLPSYNLTYSILQLFHALNDK